MPKPKNHAQILSDYTTHIQNIRDTKALYDEGYKNILLTFLNDTNRDKVVESMILKENNQYIKGTFKIYRRTSHNNSNISNDDIIMDRPYQIDFFNLEEKIIIEDVSLDRCMTDFKPVINQNCDLKNCKLCKNNTCIQNEAFANCEYQKLRQEKLRRVNNEK